MLQSHKKVWERAINCLSSPGTQGNEFSLQSSAWFWSLCWYPRRNNQETVLSSDTPALHRWGTSYWPGVQLRNSKSSPCDFFQHWNTLQEVVYCGRARPARLYFKTCDSFKESFPFSARLCPVQSQHSQSDGQRDGQMQIKQPVLVLEWASGDKLK